MVEGELNSPKFLSFKYYHYMAFNLFLLVHQLFQR